MSSLIDVAETIGNEQKNNISGLGPDVLSSYRPPPVSMGVTKDIPETIQEESESRRESMVDANARRASGGKKVETLADIAQSSEESSNSASLLSPWNEDNQTGAQNSSFCYSDSDFDGIEMNSITASVEESGTDGIDSVPVCTGGKDSTVQNSLVSGNSKIKPAQSDSIEKAIGFLLESKSKRNKTHPPVKRVKFNYV